MKKKHVSPALQRLNYCIRNAETKKTCDLSPDKASSLNTPVETCNSNKSMRDPFLTEKAHQDVE